MRETSRNSGQPILVTLDLSNVRRVGFVLVGVAAVAAFLIFVVDDGGSVIFTVLMSWFVSIAMEPAVSRLARHMRRGIATALVMATAVMLFVLFLIAFGRLLVDQVALLLRTIPELIESGIQWVNQRFGTNYEVRDILESLNVTQDQPKSTA